MAVQGEIIRGVLSYSHPNGSIMQNVFTWELQDSDESDAAVISAIDDWVDTNWVPNWEAQADNTVILFLLELDVLNNDGTVLRNLGEELHGDPGLLADEALPSAVAGFLQFDTFRTKSLGRKYIPGFTESNSVDGAWSGAIIGVLANLLLQAVVDIPVPVAGTLVAGVLSRVTAQFIEATGSGLITDIPAYQRRRKEFVGS